MTNHGQRSSDRLRLVGLVLLFMGFLLGLLQLALAVGNGMRAGRNFDVDRQWVVSRYVEAGINPYEVCLSALRHTYGDLQGDDRIRLRDVKIYDTSGTTWDASTAVLDAYGPPTATYPPSSVLLFAATIGRLSETHLHELWMTVNGLALLLVYILSRRRWGIAGSCGGVIAVAALLSGWPATWDAFTTGQFSLPALVLVLLLRPHAPRAAPVEGAILALALVKPSFSLLFILPYLTRRGWPVVAWAGCLHVGAILGLAAILHADPVSMMKSWLGISRYMLQGAFSVQEIINRLELDNTTIGSLITLAALGSAALWTWLNRNAEPTALLSFIAVATLVWTYHERYDYVLLLPAIIGAWHMAGNSTAGRVAIALMAVSVGIALTDPVYLHDTELFRLLRWAGRMGIVAMLLGSAVWVHRADRKVAA